MRFLCYNEHNLYPEIWPDCFKNGNFLNQRCFYIFMIICLLGWPYGLRIYLKEQKKIDDHSFPDFLTTYRRWANKNSKLSSLRRLSALIWTDLFLRFWKDLPFCKKPLLLISISWLVSLISSLIRLLTYQCTFWFSSSAILSP